MVKNNLMSRMKGFSLLFFLLSPHLWGLGIEFENIVEHQIPSEQIFLKNLPYSLNAKFYIQKKSKKVNTFFLNYKKYFLENNYYFDGTLETKNVQLDYYKAYYFNSKLYLFNVHGIINNKEIFAKEVIFDKNRTYVLLDCEVTDSLNIYRRKQFLIREK